MTNSGLFQLKLLLVVCIITEEFLECLIKCKLIEKIIKKYRKIVCVRKNYNFKNFDNSHSHIGSKIFFFVKKIKLLKNIFLILVLLSIIFYFIKMTDLITLYK